MTPPLCGLSHMLKSSTSGQNCSPLTAPHLPSGTTCVSDGDEWPDSRSEDRTPGGVHTHDGRAPSPASGLSPGLALRQPINAPLGVTEIAH
jgi:hypothetical protein